MLTVDNCPSCGKVYQKNLRNLCMKCAQQLNDEYETCRNYLQSNRKATTDELLSATGVPDQRFFGWLRERRLLIVDYPNLSYPCNSCGAPIRKENLCSSCRIRLTTEIKDMQEKDANRSQGIGFRSRTQRN